MAYVAGISYRNCRQRVRTSLPLVVGPLIDSSLSVVYAVGEKLNLVNLKPRTSSPVGLFSTYDGNIIGGSLLGVGMALSGSCPGTVLAQSGLGLSTGFYTLAGAVIGGLIWTGSVSKLVKVRNERLGVKSEPSTLSQNLGIPRAAAMVLFETICVAAVVGTALYASDTPESGFRSARGGLYVAAAQLFSLLARRSMLGVSGSYEEIGNFFWWIVGGAGSESKPKSYQNILFGSGVAAGAWAIAKWIPSIINRPIVEASPLLAALGGVLMIVGARLAGGCTSGHGISGMSLLSTSSIITMASAFGMGAVIAPLAY